jgi:hypothetical protein
MSQKRFPLKQLQHIIVSLSVSACDERHKMSGFSPKKIQPIVLKSPGRFKEEKIKPTTF